MSTRCIADVKLTSIVSSTILCLSLWETNCEECIPFRKGI